MKETSSIRAVRCALTLLFAVSYIANLFFAIPFLDGVNTALMAVVLAMSVFVSTGASRTIGIVLIVIGAGLLLYAQAPIEEWVCALRENANLVVMFILIPLIGIPIQYGGYKESLRGLFARHARSEGGYYALVSGMAAVVGSLISIAAVPLSYEISRESKLGANKRLLGTALSRGFITCMIWAPTSATIALAVSVTGADWVSFAPCAIFCAIIAEGVGILLTYLRCRRLSSGAINSDVMNAEDPVEMPVNGLKMLELAVFSALLVVLITAISWYFSISVIVVVALMSLLWPAIWMVSIGKSKTYRSEFENTYFNKKLPNIKNQIVLFTGAGILAQSIGYSGVGDVVAQALMLTTGQSVVLLTISIVAIVLLTCVAGIHPIVATAVIGGAIDPGLCGISAAYLALVLSISWALGNTVCPTSANVIAVAGMVNSSPIDVSHKWNGVYAVVTATALIAVVLLMGQCSVL